MKFSLSYVLFISSVYSGVDARIHARSLNVRQNTDSQIQTSFAQQGLCFSYLKGGNKEKELGPCKIWCEKQNQKEGKKSTGYGCRAPDWPNGKIDKSVISTDEDKNQWQPGKCECNFEFALAIFDVVAEGLSKLDNVLCAVMTQSFVTIAEIGVNFIPGGQAVTGVRAAVQGAKTFVENGLTAQSYFGDWIGKACGVDNWNFDLMSVFGSLTNMPDSLGTSIGCKAASKASCKKVDPKPDPPKKPDSKKPDDKKPDDKKPDENSNSKFPSKTQAKPSATTTKIFKATSAKPTLTKTASKSASTTSATNEDSEPFEAPQIPIQELPLSSTHSSTAAPLITQV